MEENLFQNDSQNTAQPTQRQTNIPVTVNNPATGFDFSSFIFGVLLLIIIIASLVGAVIWIQNWLKKKNFNKKRINDWEKTVFIEVSVPKETAEQSQKEAGSGKKDDKEVLAIGEQLFSLMSEYAQDQKKISFYG